MVDGLYVIYISGPLLKYRLDIIKDASPLVRNSILFFTDEFSYELYKDYHNFFNFIIIDKWREDYPLSLTHEVFPPYETEKEWLTNINSFYGGNSGNWYSYDIHRFAFPYLIENNILNFAIIDTDFILNNDMDVHLNFFKSIPRKTFYVPWFGEDIRDREAKDRFWIEEMQPEFPNIKLHCPFLRSGDGYIRGFKFESTEDMKLFFNIWNTGINKVISLEKYKFLATSWHAIFQIEWLISHLMQFFESERGYCFRDALELISSFGPKPGKHITRPEDTIYIPNREGWAHFKFDYSNTSTISNFIKNNKSQLGDYYVDKYPYFKITDTHVYTRYFGGL